MEDLKTRTNVSKKVNKIYSLGIKIAKKVLDHTKKNLNETTFLSFSLAQ